MTTNNKTKIVSQCPECLSTKKYVPNVDVFIQQSFFQLGVDEYICEDCKEIDV